MELTRGIILARNYSDQPPMNGYSKKNFVKDIKSDE